MSPNIILLLSTILPRAAHAATGVSALGEGDLIITEMMANPTQVHASQGEWLEVYNASGGAVDLQGMVVESGSYSFTVADSVTVAAGGHAVLAVADSANGGLPQVDYVYSFDELRLSNRSGTVTLSYGDTTLDSVTYSTNRGFPTPTGASLALDRGQRNSVDNDIGEWWCEPETSYGDGDLGTPGSANAYCPLPLFTLGAGDLVITEVLVSANEVNDRYGEWFEIANLTGEDINLRGLELASSGDSGDELDFRFIVPAGDHILLAANGGVSGNGGLTDIDHVYGSVLKFSFTDSLSISYSGLTFDAVSWDSSYPVVTGAALNLSSNSVDPNSNDSPGSWCAASTLYGNGTNYGTPGLPNTTCADDADGDGVTADADCDDSDPSVHPFAEEVCDGVDNNCDGTIDEGVTATWYRDADGDGIGVSEDSVEACAQPSGYAARDLDCDDADPGSYPGAAESCDGVDNDCDGDVDEHVTETFYADADGDGYGDPSTELEACEAPSGYVTSGGDCDDAVAEVNFGAEEVCDGIDNDCDGRADEHLTSTYYADGDGDGYGDESTAVEACEAPSGHALEAGDCDDADASVSPGTEEACDGLDNDCDGHVDETATTSYYADADGDGYGDPGTEVEACEAPAGYVTDSQDCDDADAALSPAADEICDGLDNDCDGRTDDGLKDQYYADADGDGYGDNSSSTRSCAEIDGHVLDNSDCDDANAAVSPGAEEVCDGLDNDCDASIDEGLKEDWYADADGDGYGDPSVSELTCEPGEGYVTNAEDCDDASAGAHPGAEEVCDELDNDCDGSIDEDGQESWYADADGDGYGDPASETRACEAPDGYIADGSDCDDASAGAYPGAEEVCDEVDNDCDESVDEGVTGTWYADSDGDGYGDPDAAAEGCEAPSGHIEDASDCDDSSAAVYPSAEDVCDEIDNDCDGTVDEDGDFGVFYADEDGDGYGDPDSAIEACEAPSGYVDNADDCNDGDSSAHGGGAEEICDGVDNNCDGQIDEGVTGWYYADVDEDGHGDPADAIEACEAPDGFVADDTDCDDSLSSINPSMEEACDGLDNNCDDQIDEGALEVWYADLDRDGYGDALFTAESCESVSIFDTEDATDCDDRDASIYPGAEEVCDEVDNDCDTEIDEGLLTTWYEDEDGDGYGDILDPVEACAQPSGYVSDATDCDDYDITTYPGAEEVCDGLDNDCDGEHDEGLLTTWYVDADGDGYGSADISIESCEQPDGFVDNDDDCSDCTAEEWDDSDGSCDIPDDCDCEPVLQTARVCSGADGMNIVLDASGDYSHDAVLTWVHSAWTTDIDGAEWIWSEALVSDPTSTVTEHIARDFALPFDADIQSALLEIAADNHYAVSLNGDEVAVSDGNRSFKTPVVWDVTDAMLDGDNELDFSVTNYRGGGSPYANPAGLLFCLTVDYYGEEFVDGQDEDDDYGDDTGGSDDGSTDDGSTDDGSTDDGGSDDGGWDTGGSDDGGSDDGGSDDGGTNNGGTNNGGSDDGGTNNGGSDDGSTDDGGSDDGGTDDGGWDTGGSDDGGWDTGGSDDGGSDDGGADDGGADDGGWDTGGDDGGGDDEEPEPWAIYYADEDGDGYGDPGMAVESSTPLPGFVTDSSDCDDTDAAVNAAAEEICDGIDNDCDGLIDEGFDTSGAYSEYYRDEDGDGYGDAGEMVEACALPGGYSDNGADPDDGDADITPEICDGIDNDGDGELDEALLELDFEGDAAAELLTLSGDAIITAFDGTGALELTSPAKNQRGTAMVAFPMPSDAWRVTFDFWTGGGTGADGLGLVIIDPDEKELLGSAGGGLGVMGLNGYSVEFDTWRNGNLGDPNENHVGFIANSSMTHLALNAEIPELENTGWFEADIVAADGEITVYLDGEEVLRADLPSDLPQDIMLGLAAATGAATNYHIVDDVTIGCPLPEGAGEDGAADDCTTQPFYLDADGDGYGDAAAMVEACEAPSATSATPATATTATARPSPAPRRPATASTTTATAPSTRA